jgi:hypothetical protein
MRLCECVSLAADAEFLHWGAFNFEISFRKMVF